VNGTPTDKFHFGRELRQGDPLFLFLFLIAAEGWNVMLEAYVDAALFKGYLISERQDS
jgi:hypothetical protein